MKRYIAALLVGGLCASAYAAEPGLDAVNALGELNGKALACAQQENISRIKAVMIEYAPKSRRYGAAFEVSTQESFMQRSQQQEACDDAALTALQVEDLATRLQQLFAGEGRGQ